MRREGWNEAFSKLEFDSIFQVDATRLNNSVSPLSLRERARVRAALASHTPIYQTPPPLLAANPTGL
jgi:hypothetical protein